MKLHETRKEQGIEVANREHAKGGPENGRQVGPAGLREAGRHGPAATLGDSFCTGSSSVSSAPVRVVL